MTTHLHLEAKVRMSGVIPPLCFHDVDRDNLPVFTFDLRVSQHKGYGLDHWGIISSNP
jgi:hypothetical protein